MSFTLPKAARLNTMTSFVSLVLNANSKLHLLGSSIVISDSTTLAALHAQEAGWGGYSPQTLTGWTAATEGSSPPTQASVVPTFTPTGPGTTVQVWGYYITDLTSTKLYGCESYAMSGPITIAVGSAYSPMLTYDLESLF